MASLAVFRSLYDKEKDLYSVIASFSKQLIINSSLKFEIMAKQLYVASQRVL